MMDSLIRFSRVVVVCSAFVPLCTILFANHPCIILIPLQESVCIYRDRDGDSCSSGYSDAGGGGGGGYEYFLPIRNPLAF